MKNPYILLARSAVENYIKKGDIISPPDDLPEDLFQRRCGVFVTITRRGKLRGCIGTFLPTKENLAQEIISNSIAAATKDYRFPPLEEQELPSLKYTVYLLNKPEKISGLEDLDPKKYGVLVRKESEVSVPKTGLLLPDLEGVETAQRQVSIACRKAGINADQEEFSLYRFTVEKYSSLK